MENLKLSDFFKEKLDLAEKILKNNFVGGDPRCKTSPSRKYNLMTHQFLYLRNAVENIKKTIKNKNLQGITKYCRLERELTKTLSGVCLKMAVTNNNPEWWLREK